jgi:hypothetical protein
VVPVPAFSCAVEGDELAWLLLVPGTTVRPVAPAVVLLVLPTPP